MSGRTAAYERTERTERRTRETRDRDAHHAPTSRTTRASAAAAATNSTQAPDRETRAGATSPGLTAPPAGTTRRPRSAHGSAAEILREKRLRTITTTTTTTTRVRSPAHEEDKEKPRSFSKATGAQAQKAAPPPPPWTPEATLIAPTTAPLASRVSVPPLATQLPPAKQPPPLSQMTLELQEAAILEDLLFVFMGYEGQYIRFREEYDPSSEIDRLTGAQFKVLPGLDPSLRDMTDEMLKMATYYMAVEAFVEVQSREEFGAVNHALCAAIRKLLKDYLILIAQLEHQFITNSKFTLHILHLHIQPTAKIMSVLHALAHEMLIRNQMLGNEEDDDSLDDFEDVEDILESLREGGDIGSGRSKICKGGSVLGLLTHQLTSRAGDPAARNLLSMLLRESSRPYMTMLNEWLHHGGIRDPHAEFLVKEQKSIGRARLEEDYTDEYWEKRYTIRDGDVPPQLEGVKEKVLLAGKYLNVVRECGGVDVSKEVQDVPKTFDDARFLENVNSAYAHANESLLKLLLTTHALPQRLRSLKHYFFLDRSDFFTYFLDLGHSELRKPAKEVNVSKLQSLLELALRQPGSVAASDPFKEDVKVTMNDITLNKWLMRVVNVSGEVDEGSGVFLDESKPTTASEKDKEHYIGYHALEFDYVVPFPLSLVISRKTILRYQLLFRYLLQLRFLEMRLGTAWQAQNAVYPWKARSKYPQVESTKRRAYTLRARMMVFIQQLMYFCTSEVIEPNWEKLQKRLEKVTTVDDLMQDHVDFLDTCLKECMLTNAKLLRVHAKLTHTCEYYSQFTPDLTRYLGLMDPDLLRPKERPVNATPDMTRLKKMTEHLSTYEMHFSKHLKILLESLNYYAATETVVFLELCARLQTAWGEGEGGGGIVGQVG